jgi:uncharacterized delta-60 repeat protein
LSVFRGSRRGARRAISGAAGAALAACCLALPTAAAPAAPGDLDNSFGGGDGRSTVDLQGDDALNGMALQPDGKIVVSGSTYRGNNNSDIAVARLLNPQGTLDTSYGPGGSGWSQLDFGPQAYGSEVALQPDGKIDVVGTTTQPGPGTEFVVAQLLNPQGTLDTSFGSPNGFLFSKYGNLSTSGAVDRGKAIALQPDGKILVGGDTTVNGSSDFAVARVLNPDGALDTSYGLGSGASLISFEGNTGGDDVGSDIVQQPDGRIVVAGWARNGPAGGMGVARLLNPEGTPDASFGAGTGRVQIDFAGGAIAQAVALQPDGKIILAGESGNTNFAVARLLPGGSLDDSFGAGGKAVINFAGQSGVSDVALQPDGKIVLVGYAGDNFGVARLQPNGSLDTTFGSGGKTEIGYGPVAYGVALAMQPDGKIVVAGETHSPDDFAIARLQGDPGGPAAKSKCGGKKATIIGTNAKDKLKGTKKRDVIAALGGKDAVKGLGGNDLICGGKGKDKLLGGKGNDTLLGGPGKDKLKGGPGKDKLKGGPGKDSEKP